jgi:membrane-bound acyltransferase YfiQ involved in biofilm formation
MIRRVFLLSGLAILAVVLSHAAGWGQVAMFLWTDRYRPVTVPNYDQLGSLSYYILLVIRQLTVWSVPAFLFVSGFFVAYAARGSQSVLGWRMVKGRLTSLLVPYALWSGVCFTSDALQGIVYTPAEYLKRLAFGQADGGAYFYVPLLCGFYLLSPLTVPIAKTHSRLLLLMAALLQLGSLGLRYLVLLPVGITDSPLISVIIAPWLFVRWSFFFALGVVWGFEAQQLKGWLTRYKWTLIVVAVILGVLAVVEPEIVYRTTGKDWRFIPFTFATSLYSVAFILCFLVFDEISIPLPNTVQQIGRRSYAIYLLHLKVMEFVARAVRQILPWILAHQVQLLMPMVFTFGLGIPLLMMASVSRSPLRRSYRYLFG